MSIMRSLFVAALAFCMVMGSHDAQAAETPSCVPSRVDTDGGRIALWRTGGSTILYVFRSTTTTNCGKVDADTMKMWLSMIQSALLAGKPLHIFYTAPTSTSQCKDNTITSVGLKN
jgi:hypothetical protein